MRRRRHSYWYVQRRRLVPTRWLNTDISSCLCFQVPFCSTSHYNLKCSRNESVRTMWASYAFQIHQSIVKTPQTHRQLCWFVWRLAMMLIDCSRRWSMLCEWNAHRANSVQHLIWWFFWVDKDYDEFSSHPIDYLYFRIINLFADHITIGVTYFEWWFWTITIQWIHFFVNDWPSDHWHIGWSLRVRMYSAILDEYHLRYPSFIVQIFPRCFLHVTFGCVRTIFIECIIEHKSIHIITLKIYHRHRSTSLSIAQSLSSELLSA